MLIAPLGSARDVTADTAVMYRSPRRLKPSDACAKFLKNERGSWDPDTSPEMIEPLDLMATRRYRGIVLVGPARSGKTFTLIIGAIAYAVTSSPGDMLIVQMSRDVARDFSRTDIDRAFRHSPELGEQISPRPRDDNIFDKNFRSGMEVKFAWPAVSQLSGKTRKYVVIPDYDRPTNRDDVEGEGPLWDLARKRTETYMSRGKTMAESSPDAVMVQTKWRPATPHEAPPCRGILELYNRGTRARRYWPCLHCGAWFQAEPGLGCFAVPTLERLELEIRDADLNALSEKYARIGCRECGAMHTGDNKRELRRRGIWLHEGESIEADGTISGTRIESDIASFWLGGCAAAYQTWQAMIYKYLQAVRTFVATGDEAPLKFTTNTDQAAVHVPPAIAKRKGPESLMARAESWPKGLLPIGVRFLVAAVDVQAGRFVVQVKGYGVGLEGWLVDRFEITSSKRVEGNRTAGLDPASFTEDWDLLLAEVADKTYPYEGMLDIKLSPRLTVIDSGGKAGVTTRAYEFWRRARDLGYGRRVMLIKGTGLSTAPRCSLTWPDSRGRSDRQGGGVGDVPVLLINTNMIKDGVANDYARESPGAGYAHVPEWLEASWYDELMAETRTIKGWTRTAGQRNEAFDLECYARAACVALEAEKINWSVPPEWAVPATHRLPRDPDPTSPARPRGRRMRDQGIT
jgi:phage terminase large subunit GpA-like protein